MLPRRKDLLVPGLDLLEAGHRAVRALGDPAGERLLPLILRNVVLVEVAVEVFETGHAASVAALPQRGPANSASPACSSPWRHARPRIALPADAFVSFVTCGET
jgi:hypothetical protein